MSTLRPTTRVAENIYRDELTGEYFFVATIPHSGGKQKRGRGHKTIAAAQKARRAFLALHDRGGPVVEPSRETLGKYLTGWYENRRTQVRPSTWRRDGYHVRDILAVLSHVPLCELRRQHVQTLMTALDAKGQGPASVNRARAMLRKCLAEATDEGLIVANPASATKRRQVERPELVVPDAAGLGALQREAVGTVHEIPMLLATSIGTRRGETLAPTWADVDLDTGRVRIVRAVQRIDGELRLVDLKTPRARRTVVMPATTRERLRRHKREQAEAMLALGVRQTPATLVCANPVGGPLDPDGFTKAARRFARQAGLPGARLHDSRHGYATQLLAQGVHPGIASAVLGHSDPGFTMRTYQHVLDGMGEVAAEAIERAIGGTQ